MAGRKRWIAAGAALLVLTIGATMAFASAEHEGRDDDATQRAITGEALERASEAALEHTGGGEVTETEVGDEESYYEVEVTTDDGQVDVQLDKGFRVVGSESETGDDD